MVRLRPHDSKEPIMQAVKTIGLDIAKSGFQVHGIDADGQSTGPQVRRTGGAESARCVSSISVTHHELIKSAER